MVPAGQQALILDAHLLTAVVAQGVEGEASKPRLYHTDPLRCPKDGGTMKIIAFIEARRGQIVRQNLLGEQDQPDLPWDC